MSEEKNKGGRPPKLTPDENTLGIVRGLGNIQATTKECASVLGVSEPTYLKFKSDHPEVAEHYAEGAGQGLASLRRTQFRMAETNASMAIWLGKQYLDQSDKQQVEQTMDVSDPLAALLTTIAENGKKITDR